MCSLGIKPTTLALVTQCVPNWATSKFRYLEETIYARWFTKNIAQQSRIKAGVSSSVDPALPFSLNNSRGGACEGQRSAGSCGERCVPWAACVRFHSEERHSSAQQSQKPVKWHDLTARTAFTKQLSPCTSVSSMPLVKTDIFRCEAVMRQWTFNCLKDDFLSRYLNHEPA